MILSTTSPSESTNVVATTISLWTDSKFRDNVFDVYPLLEMLKADQVGQAGGQYIQVPIMYKKNSLGTWFKGAQEIPAQTTAPFGEAAYLWCEYAIPIAVSQRDLLLNQGDSAKINMIRALMENAEMSAQDDFNQRFITGNASVANSPIGLYQGVCATGEVGGLNPATEGQAFWAAQADTVANVRSSTSTVLAKMYSTMLKCTRGKQKPTKILTTEGGAGDYWYELNKNERYTSGGPKETGTDQLKFMGAEVFSDRMCTSQTMYLLTPGTFVVYYHPEANLTTLEWQRGNNQLAKSTYIYWLGALCFKERRRNGVLTGFTA